MTEDQQKQVALQKSVMNVMEAHLAEWRNVTALRKKYDMFVRNIKKIDDHDAGELTDINPLKLKATKLKTCLIKQILPVTGVLGLFALDSGSGKLQKLAQARFPELERMKAGKLSRYGYKVLKTCKLLLDSPDGTHHSKSGADLPGYGLSTTHLEQLHSILEQFTAHKEELTQAQRAKRYHKKKLDFRIRENKTLMKGDLDRMMHLFRDSHEEFYNQYMEARSGTE